RRWRAAAGARPEGANYSQAPAPSGAPRTALLTSQPDRVSRVAVAGGERADQLRYLRLDRSVGPDRVTGVARSTGRRIARAGVDGARGGGGVTGWRLRA